MLPVSLYEYVLGVHSAPNFMSTFFFNLTWLQKILAQGLDFCPNNESLMIKGIKHEEKLGSLESARCLLSRLKNESINKTWRIMVEGALLEARAGICWL